MAKQYGFQYELVQYKWPRWLHQQTEKQRIIWGYKILFLDVLFPLAVDKILFVDADQVRLRHSCANIHPASVQIFNTLFTTIKVSAESDRSKGRLRNTALVIIYSSGLELLKKSGNCPSFMIMSGRRFHIMTDYSSNDDLIWIYSLTDSALELQRRG